MSDIFEKKKEKINWRGVISLLGGFMMHLVLGNF